MSKATDLQESLDLTHGITLDGYTQAEVQVLAKALQRLHQLMVVENLDVLPDFEGELDEEELEDDEEE